MTYFESRIIAVRILSQASDVIDGDALPSQWSPAPACSFALALAALRRGVKPKVNSLLGFDGSRFHPIMHGHLLADLQGALGLCIFVASDFPSLVTFLNDDGFVREFEDWPSNLIRFRGGLKARAQTGCGTNGHQCSLHHMLLLF